MDIMGYGLWISYLQLPWTFYFMNTLTAKYSSVLCDLLASQSNKITK